MIPTSGGAPLNSKTYALILPCRPVAYNCLLGNGVVTMNNPGAMARLNCDFSHAAQSLALYMTSECLA